MFDDTTELRPVTDSDRPFLLALYGMGRAGEMAGWGWSEAQQRQFIEMQFAARERHYAAAYPERDDLVIVQGREPVGRMIVARRKSEFVLVDIALVPQLQGRGIGAAHLAELKNEAGQAGKPLRLRVLGSNSGAVRFYERLGFKAIGDDGTYLHLEWQPTAVRCESCEEI